jgi:hypothetical protein
MPTPASSTKASLTSRVNDRARHRWPQLSAVQVRFRGGFAYLDGQLPDGETLPLCRLRYAGSASTWGSRSTAPAATTTRTATSPTASALAAPKTHSTASAGYTSTTHRMD